MNLAVWQERLKRHFGDLRQQRSSIAAPDKPIFGLEHGLTASEIEGLQVDVQEQILGSPPSNDQGLPWIVYACEIGYQYSGDEYWETFEACTPGWDVNGERAWLRDQFHSFHSHFGGAKPSGPWADHFSIICWPITNAILPLDLQRQLAKVLYNMRGLFSADLLL